MLWQLYDYKGTINSFYHKQIHLHPTGVRRNMCFPCNNDDDDDDLEVAHPQSGSSSTRFLIELDMEMLVFEERGKPEYPEKNLSEQGREPTTNSTHIWRRYRDLNPGHIGGRRALSHCAIPCSPISYSENLSFLPYGFSSPPQLRIKQKEFTEEWNLRISSNLFHRWEKSTPLVSTLFVAIMAFTSDLFLQKLMDKLTFLTESDTRTPLLGTTGSAPYTCAEPYHLGSGSHGKLFRPYYN